MASALLAAGGVVGGGYLFKASPQEDQESDPAQKRNERNHDHIVEYSHEVGSFGSGCALSVCGCYHA